MPENKHTILYVMRHVDVGNHIEIPYKKIGITGAGSADLSSRLKQLSSTKSPIQTQCIAAWECDSVEDVESAFHSMLSNERVEGEWFYDKDDDLISRITPMLKILKARTIEISKDEDLYTKTIMKNEENIQNTHAISVLGEILPKIKYPMETSIRIAGPTIFSNKTGLTYYINIRKSGMHNLDFGRSKDKFQELDVFLRNMGFDVEKHERGFAMINGLTIDSIADIVNRIEEDFAK